MKGDLVVLEFLTDRNSELQSILSIFLGKVLWGPDLKQVEVNGRTAVNRE